MVAPGNRRPGHSRRAQYSTFFQYLAAVVGLCIGVLLLLVSLGDSSAFAGARSSASATVAPAGQAGAKLRSDGQGWLSIIGGYFTRGSRVAKLEREVAEARVQLAEQAAVKEENARLKALLGLTESDPRPVTVTRLIGSTSSSTRRFATLGAGSRQGIKIGMAVRSPQGLVGRVLEVGPVTARVLLITDSESTIPVRRAQDGVQAYATGQGDGTLKVRLAATGINPLRKGDAIVTSGSGGLFRPNEAVAVVISLLPDGAIARPLSDPGMTEFVAVEPLYDELAAPAEAQPEAR
ncbi:MULTISPECIES: rod shape-determining protein MreC [unclassified Novosphingobium]|uniref:rod shape-determining protein MreC n=1 Tax=unclassified Novosphingobium TaxID=2644732 RepID=UPI0025EF2737|nr:MULTISPECIES: rod shape-determining protein MreC [unclassified Novosphingobium]HQV02808.1 rod shape-determining protein MreC [Novosphingobium sp.]